MHEGGPEIPRSLPGKEMLNERFSWLLKYGQQVPMRLLAKAAAENGYSDAIDYIYADTTKLSSIATLFDLPTEVLFASQFLSEAEFASYIK
jgi:hypothetical protein